MKFIMLIKFRKKPTKEIIAQNLKIIDEEEKRSGVKSLDVYWTLGRYDAVAVAEAPNEQALMKMSMRLGENLAIESMAAVPAVEARKLAE